MGNKTGDRAVLTDGDIHGQVQQHWVIVIDVQCPDPHQHLGTARGGRKRRPRVDVTREEEEEVIGDGAR
jgi:hypothetical protein